MNKYQLIERIDGNIGGFGEVYRGVRLADGGEVAVKMLREPNNQSAREAFRREIDLLRNLHHPHVIELLDFNVTTDRPFYVMTLMRGGCLTAWAGRLPEAKLREIFTQIVDAVAHMHAQGILHRDLKLDNVLVSARGRCAVGDFGLGNRPGCTMILTVAGIGTPGYMAPELYNGWARATTASDIYSLGALLFHLLTGVHPNDANSLDPSVYRSRVPVDLRSLVLKMTSLEASTRPTAREVLARLQRRQPFFSAPPKKRRAGETAGAAIVCGLLLFGIGIAAAASR